MKQFRFRFLFLYLSGDWLILISFMIERQHPKFKLFKDEKLFNCPCLDTRFDLLLCF